jgi:hypothetical protein
MLHREAGGLHTQSGIAPEPDHLSGVSAKKCIHTTSAQSAIIAAACADDAPLQAPPGRFAHCSCDERVRASAARSRRLGCERWRQLGRLASARLL